jgi:hypothetical protein
MNHEPENSEDEVPRSEPEIIPPPRAGSRSQFRHAMWFASDRHGMRRIYVARLGPFRLILLALGIVLVAVCVIFLLAGFILISIPVFVILMVVSIITVLLPRSFRR